MLAKRDQDNFVDYFPVQSCLWAVAQLCTGKALCNAALKAPGNIAKNSGQCCLDISWTILHRSKPYAIFSKGLETTFCQKNTVQWCHNKFNNKSSLISSEEHLVTSQ